MRVCLSFVFFFGVGGALSACASPDPPFYVFTSDKRDSDADGLSDFEEQNGCLSHLLINEQEICSSFKKFSPTNPLLIDSDGDILLDSEEVFGCLGYRNKNGFFCTKKVFKSTNPVQKDTDEDGLWDGGEVWGCDLYLTPSGKYACGKETYFMSSPVEKDSDGDTFTDFEEVMGCSATTDAKNWTFCAPGLHFAPSDPFVYDDIPFERKEN